MVKNKANKRQASPRIGRPRANLKSPSGPVRQEILDAARALFSEKGYKGTSTREIADRAGLRQPSLFHYFKNKAEIFKVIVLGAVQPPLNFIEQERKANLAPEVALYRFLRYDTYHLCTNENMIGSPGEFPGIAQIDQPNFLQLRQNLSDYIRELLHAGMQSSIFYSQDLAVLTHLVFGLVESMLNWYQKSENLDPELVAEMTATFVLRSVLADASMLETIAEDAGALEYDGSAQESQVE